MESVAWRITALSLLVATCAGGLFAQAGWREVTPGADWSERGLHTTAHFDNRLWVLGGHGPQGSPATIGYFGDVWSSQDGDTWTQETASVPWGMRSAHQTVVFNGRMWVIGGIENTGAAAEMRNDVWSSPDGINWTQETGSAPWAARGWHQAVVFMDRIWILGGMTGQTPQVQFLNDVWSSLDGATWVQETSAAAWMPRHSHEAVAYDSKLWVMSGLGQGGAGAVNDVWSSPDGANWTLETGSAPWAGRFNSELVVFQNEMFVMGGHTGVGINVLGDVWSSTDGSNWTQQSSVLWQGRTVHSAVATPTGMWMMGGAFPNGGTLGYANDVWVYGELPEIEVSKGSQAIVDGSTTNVGNLTTGRSTLINYTIANTGGGDLHITGPATVNNLVNCSVTITAQPAATVAAGATTVLQIEVSPFSSGAYSYDITIPNDDADESPFDFTATGNANNPGISVGGCAASGGSNGLFAVLLAVGAVLVLARTLRRRKAQSA